MAARKLIGRMRHRITFEEPSEDRNNDYNEAQLSYADLATAPSVWAEIVPLSGEELVEARQVDSRVTHRITCRYRAEFTSRKRCYEGTRVFEIVEMINVEEADRFWQITAIEKPANA